MALNIPDKARRPPPVVDGFLREDKLAASSVHGEAAPAAFQQALNDAVTAFIVDRNVDNFANTLVQAAKESQSTK
jgi:hypothetical protein